MDLKLKPRQAVEDEMENWDDDDLDIAGDDFAFHSRATSIATTAPSHHRDSIASRLSMRSDFDSNHGDEDKHVSLPGDDDTSTSDAIAVARRAGIPIPPSVPTSALMGGTIRRLGGKKIKNIIQQDDWDDDLELPGPGDEGFKIKRHDAADFPDTLRQVSGPSTQPSPAKTMLPAPVFGLSPRPSLGSKMPSPNLNLDRFRDDEDDNDFLGNGDATIKVSKNRAIKPMTLIMPPSPAKEAQIDDDFEADLQLPSDGQPLRLSARKDIPKTPVSAQDEFDEWGEGSLGTRFGGTKRDGRSNRSSSVSALSPSVASSLTVESEDEGLDGLVLPPGPLKFDEILKKRQQNQSPENDAKKQAARRASVKDDFLAGLEIGDGDVFDSSKLTLNRNIKVKSIRPMTPQRPKAAVSLTFTNKPSPPVNSKLPRPLVHDRVSSTLAPVSESGGPIANRARPSLSRIGGSSAHVPVSTVQTPTTPSSTYSAPPATPHRRELASKPSISALRNEPTTTSSQLLKVKRSMPIMRPPQSPAKPIISRYDRPPSRTEGGTRPSLLSRPKTPVERDRSGAESSMSHARRNPLPFLPAGASQSQSQHITIKTSRHLRRNDSESSNELRPQSRTVSRSTMRSPSPIRPRLRGAEALAREAAAKRQITKPIRRRHFGDGFELDGFDDLPTSQVVEQKFIKQPISKMAPKSLLRNKISHSTLSEATTPVVPLTPYSPARHNDNLPRFARDTNASRMAREQVLSQRAPSNGAPLATLTNQWKAQVAAKTGLTTINPVPARAKKGRPVTQQKPHLIKPMGDVSKTSKSIKGMIYNPLTFRWEGNENDLSPFDGPSTSPSIASMPQFPRGKETPTLRPALITNINASQGVQVVGGMVFDPQKMCWLKVPALPPKRGVQSETSGGDTMDGFDAFDDDEEDVFKDVPDLEDKAEEGAKEEGGRTNGGDGGLKDDWLVGEEFDVGPEFVRRQREEEERWRKKCEKWVGAQRDAVESEDWRWRIRDVVNEL